MTNVGLTDKTALLLADAIEKNKTLRVLNVETNFINPPVIVKLVSSLLKVKSIEEFRASNQVGFPYSSICTGNSFGSLSLHSDHLCWATK